MCLVVCSPSTCQVEAARTLSGIVSFEANMGFMGQCLKNPKSQRGCLWKSRLYIYVQGTGFISGTILTAKEKEPLA